MAFVVETGSGLSTANSYLSVADADSYHTDHGAPAAWTAATTAAKQSALQLATQYIDAMYGERWLGERINETMALDWPRYNVIDRDGYTVASTAVPAQVEQATAILALNVVNGDTLIPDMAAGANVVSEAVSVGSISSSKTYAGYKTAGKLYPLVAKILAPLTGGSGKLYRA